MIWASQLCVTRFVLKFCASPSIHSLNGSICLCVPSLCRFVDVGGPPICVS